MKKIFISTVATLAFFMCAGNVHASDTRNWRSPVFENVERVYLHVSYGIYRDQDELPEILRKENLEKHFLRIYKERFSSKDCQQHLIGKNPYSCDDQPVILVPQGSGWARRRDDNDNGITSELAGNDGTLNVVFQLYLIENPLQTSPPSGTPMVIYEIIHERPKLDLPIYFKRLSGMNAIPLNQSDEKMEEQILRSIKGSLDIGTL